MVLHPDVRERITHRLREVLQTGAWTKAYLAVLGLFALFLLYKGFLTPYAPFSDDRAALLELREAWDQAAPGYGLSVMRNPREDFIAAYQRFHSRKAIKQLLKDDEPFAEMAARASSVLAMLETAELRGSRTAFKYAAEFNSLLYLMDSRVDTYAQSQARSYRNTVLVMAAALVAAIAGFSLLEYRFRASSAGAARNRAFSRALLAAQEGERLRISYELHDTVAQDLATAKLYCGLCEGPYAEQATRLLDKSIEGVRSICHGLRPAELDRLGIFEAVSRLCSEMGRDTGIDVKLTVEGLDSLELEQETEINLFRILQEALTNVRRHAQAKHVRVVLFGFGDYIELTVDDDGRGPQGAKPGLGRTGMEERARMVGGQFHFGYGPWGGVSLRATLPSRRKEVS